MLPFDPLLYRTPSRRTVAVAKGGMVATSHPLAAEIGRDTLKAGGNAVDAALAAAATLTMAEPTSNGIGGDCFALLWHGGRLHCLNASGYAPAALHADHPRLAGRTEIPRFGWLPVTVPGVPAGWGALSERFGRLSLETALRPAIELSEQGFPVAPTVGKAWQRAYEVYAAHCKDPAFDPWFQLFAPEGRAPRIGEHWRPAYFAKTLRAIAASGGEAELDNTQALAALAEMAGRGDDATLGAAFGNAEDPPLHVLLPPTGTHQPDPEAFRRRHDLPDRAVVRSVESWKGDVAWEEFLDLADAVRPGLERAIEAGRIPRENNE